MLRNFLCKTGSKIMYEGRKMITRVELKVSGKG